MPPKKPARLPRTSASGAPKKKSREPPTPEKVEDAEEALSLGIASEDRCERYMTSFGSTAFRALGTAYTYFVRGYKLASIAVQRGDRNAYQLMADGAYNAARTQYTLAAQFTSPPMTLAALDEALAYYALATQAEATHAPNSDFSLDISYNHATAAQARAELLLDVGRPSSQEYEQVGLVSRGTVDLDAVRSDFQLAGTVYVRLGSAYLARMLGRTLVPETETETPPTDLPEQPPTESGTGPSAASIDGAIAQGDTYAYTVSHINFQSVLDALEGAISCARQWWGTWDAAPATEADWTPAVQENLTAIQSALDQCSLTPDPVDPQDADAHRFARERLALWALELRVARAEHIADPGVVPECLSLASAALQGLPTTLAAEPEAVLASQVASLCLDISGIGARAAVQAPLPAESVQTSWDLASVGSKLLLHVQAYAANVRASAQPGGSVISPSEQQSSAELVVDTNVSLAQASLLRANPVFQAQLAAGTQGAAHTQGLLLANARVYIRKALQVTSLSWVLNASQGSTLTLAAHRYRRVDGDSALMWDRIQSEASALTTYVRIARLRAHLGLDAQAPAEVERLTHAVRTLILVSLQGSVPNRPGDEPSLNSAWRLAWLHVAPTRAEDDGSLPTWVLDLADTEAWGSSDPWDERSFCSAWTTALAQPAA